MPKHMMIQIEDKVNERLAELARINRRSKRMEVLFALDYYTSTHPFYLNSIRVQQSQPEEAA